MSKYSTGRRTQMSWSPRCKHAWLVGRGVASASASGCDAPSSETDAERWRAERLAMFARERERPAMKRQKRAREVSRNAVEAKPASTPAGRLNACDAWGAPAAAPSAAVAPLAEWQSDAVHISRGSRRGAVGGAPLPRGR
eukprot:scaffold27524_cov61-Phaeocystis_antarctica.AAC.3